MKRLIFLRSFLFGTSVLIVAPALMGQVYTGSILYPLTPPPGMLYDWSTTASGGQAAGSVVPSGNYMTQAALWTSTGNSVKLGPSGDEVSFISDTDGTNQVGYGGGGSQPYQALLWSGTAASAVNLNPANLGITSSNANAVFGNQQVGSGNGAATSNNYHALLWNGTAASAVDLSPSNLNGIDNSQANGTDGIQQVGLGYNRILGNGYTNQALLWTGTAASAIDLQPTNLGAIATSQAEGNSSFQQVGQFNNASLTYNHALLWNGTAASAVDLNPTGFANSYASATNGIEEVGYGVPTGSKTNNPEALFWAGTADSAINLSSLLPTGTTWVESWANSIDSAGNIYGTAYKIGGYPYAVEWTPISEPSTASWIPTAGGSWAGGSGWSTNATPNAATSITFNTGSTAQYTVTLSASSSANNMTVQDNVTIQKSGFNLAVPGTVTISGTASQPASLVLAGSGLSTFASLQVNGFGQLDITDNTVIINYGAGNASPAGNISGYIATGYNSGAWNGAGVISSKVASVNASLGNPHTYAIGYADASDPAVAADHFTPGTVVIEPALVGDANLDGKVNFADFLLLAPSFNDPGASWDQGNFNYGPKTDFNDFLLLAANFGQSTSLDNAQLTAMNQMAISGGYTLTANADGNGFALTAVPEPAELSMLVAAAAGILSRRGRRLI